MNADAYLERIGYTGPLEPTTDVLMKLHKQHMYSVPFENLSIPLKQPIELSLPSLFEKIVERRRGGFCYELNALFAWLLQEIGFKAELLSGRVFSDEVVGPEFDHMLLLVDTGTMAIADVGFGDSFVEPVLLDGDEHLQHGYYYRIMKQGEAWVLQRRDSETDWNSRYMFTLRRRQLDDFQPMCRYHQTSPDSNFTNKSVCSMATRDGRVTLSNDRFIVTAGRQRREEMIAGIESYRALLNEVFGIDFGDEVDVAILMHPGSPSN